MTKEVPQSSITQSALSTIELLILHSAPSATDQIASVLTQAGYNLNWQQAATITELGNSLDSQPDIILYHAALTQSSAGMNSGSSAADVPDAGSGTRTGCFEPAQPTLSQVINFLLSNNFNIPVLVVGGKSSISEAVAAIRAGATDYIPWEQLDQLPAAVAKALAKQPLLLEAQYKSQTEQQLQKLITENADGILVVNQQGIVQFMNPAALQLLGKTSEQLMGESLGFPVVNGDYLEVDIAQTEKNVVAQMRVSEIKWQGADAYIVSLRDITHLKEAQEERAKLLQKAEAANRAKDQFLAIISHELRTPLNSILGWSQLLSNGSLNEAQSKKAIEIIQRNAGLQAQLIDDILDIARMIRGKVKLQAASVNLVDIINSALDTVRLAAQARSIQIHTNLNENVGLVKGDPTRLAQVVWNLLSNAIKFTPNGGSVEVSLTLVNTTVGTQVSQAQIQVKDTGKGIEPEFLPHVFDYFRQAENAKSRSQAGLGLGLAIARHLIELHGGTIAVASDGVGKGATFTVLLPLLQTTNQTPLPKTSQPLKKLEGVKVLIVDDNDDSINLLTFVLEYEGAKIKSAGSATEALTLFQQFQPDILISDIGMPRMNGYELIGQIRKRSPAEAGNVKAIALSAYASDSDQHSSIAAGFNCHINKPLDLSNLIKTITALVNQNSESPNTPPRPSRVPELGSGNADS